MQVQVLGAVPAAYGAYGKEGDPDRPTWKSGAAVEFVTLVVDGDTRTMTLDESVNGSRTPVGVPADLLCSVVTTQDVVYDRGGRERIRSRDKWKIIHMEAAPPAEPGK